MPTATTQKLSNRPRRKRSAPDVLPYKKLVLGDKIGLAAAIERLQQAEIHAAGEYQAAVNGGDGLRVFNKQNEWLKAVEQLRKVEKDNPDIQKSKGDTLLRGDVERGVSKMVMAFRAELKNMGRSLAGRLVGAPDEASVFEIVDKATDAVLENLHDGGWNGKVP